jgi:CRP-like cAMP-binding protein
VVPHALAKGEHVLVAG